MTFSIQSNVLAQCSEHQFVSCQIVRTNGERQLVIVPMTPSPLYGYWFIRVDDSRVMETRNTLPTILPVLCDAIGYDRKSIEWQKPVEAMAYTSGDNLMPESVGLPYGESFADKFDQSMGYGD